MRALSVIGHYKVTGHNMDFKKPRSKPEKDGAKRLIEYMESQGWWCIRMNIAAGYFTTAHGFPDYIAFHKMHGMRLIETKAPNGRLERSQAILFSKFAEYGVGVWILHDEKDYHLLFQPMNFHIMAMQNRVK